MNLVRSCLSALLTLLYRVEVQGLEHFQAAGPRVLVVANHTSFLDAVLLAVFLPERLTFAVNSHVAEQWWLRPLLRMIDAFPMSPTNPYSTRALIQHLRNDRKTVIFPEGRITVTGSLMKIYDGTGMIADKSGAAVLPVRIDGAQLTPFSRLRGRVRLRWFPRIRLTILPPTHISIPAEIRGRARRQQAAARLSDLMTDMMFATSDQDRTLFEAVLDAKHLHGGRHRVLEDIERRPLTYNALLMRVSILGRLLRSRTTAGERVGVLLPNAVATVTSFFSLQAHGRVPAMLNFSVGAQAMATACTTAGIRTVLTSKRFIAAAKLEEGLHALQSQGAQVVYLEELAAQVQAIDKLRALLSLPFTGTLYRRHAAGARSQDAAVVLFTSGSEGVAKGVVLSHANLLANREQIATLIPFSNQDVILNALPIFHSFGLTAGTLLPLLAGMRTFLYPSPLHYRIVPEIAYDINATALFGTNTFLKGYARYAHPYDFYSVRYVFAGAEKLQNDTRQLWMEKFGIRLFEGYGATETSPVMAANTPMNYRSGSPGRLLPGIEARLEPVAGVADGGRLHVRGPNIMLGYLLAGQPGQVVPPSSSFGPGWYDTGDIVRLDTDGFIYIQGRAKRFAKIGGEMVSLAAVEELASRTWPVAQHAVVSLPDAQKGEQLVLLTTQATADRKDLLMQARSEGAGELGIPKRLVITKALPVLGTGKTDYAAVRAAVEPEVSA